MSESRRRVFSRWLLDELWGTAYFRVVMVMVFTMGAGACNTPLEEDGTQIVQQALPHYDFENDYEPGYCAAYADPIETGGIERAVIDAHGQSFTPERRRPTWSEISTGRHYFDAERTTGYDEDGNRIIDSQGALRVPDYRLISNNFNVLNSLTLLLSSLTKVTDTIEDIDENGIGNHVMQYVDEAICSGFGDEVGDCICSSPGSQLPCDGAFANAQAVLDDVGQAFDGLPQAASQAFESVGRDFIDLLINGEPNHTPGIRQAILYLVALTGINPNPSAIDAPDWLDVSLDPASLADYNGIVFPDGATLAGPPDPLHVQIQDETTQWLAELEDSVDTYMTSYESAFSVEDPNFECIAATSAFTDFQADSTALFNQLSTLPNTLVAAYADVLAAWNSALTLLKDFWEDLKTLWGKVKALWTPIADADDASEITQVNWSSFSDKIQDIITSATALFAHVQSFQALAADIQNLMNELMDTANEIQLLATDTMNTATELGQAFEDCADTFSNYTVSNSSCGLPQIDQIPAVVAATTDLCSYLSVDIDEPNSLGHRVWSELEQEWQRVLHLLELARDGFLNHFAGDGTAILVEDLLTDLLTNYFGGVASEILDCHSRDTRCNCALSCEAKGQELYLWMPVDYTTNPGAAVGSAGLFALEQTGLLDIIVQTISDVLEDYLGDAVSFAANALGGITEVVERVLTFFSDVFRYIDQFSSGYHIGAYNDVRPDLHMCVAWAGHAAYAEFGGGNDDSNFSIGARYGHHQLSEKRRVRFGSGGFAAQFREHQVALAPSLGIYKHIDGFKMWSQQRPLGLNLGNSSFNGDFSRANDLADIFHLTTPDNGTGGGQLFEAAMANGAGAMLVRDLYPVQPAYAGGTPVPRPPGAGVWPRLPDRMNGLDGWTYETSAPPWDDTTPNWEQESDAVVSLGLNLGFDFGEEEWSLPEIPVFSTGVFEATLRLFFRLAMGIGWEHETDGFLERIIGNVNHNLPEGFDEPQLSYPADFARDMHAMQAPDVTAENGTYIYATPTIGGEISAKATFRIIEIALRVSMSLGIRIEPGATAGLMDLNAALAKVLQNSNPPAEADCSPVIGSAFNSFCTASRYKPCASTSDCPTGSVCSPVPGSDDARVCSPICTGNLDCAYGDCDFSATPDDGDGNASAHQGGVCPVPHSSAITYTDEFADTNCNPIEGGSSCGVSFFYENSMSQPMLFCIDEWLTLDEYNCNALEGYVSQYENGLISLAELIENIESIKPLEFITSTLSGLLDFAGSTPDPTPNCPMLDGTVQEDYLGVCCLANGTCAPETMGACCHLAGDTDACMDGTARSCDELIQASNGGVFRPGIKCADMGEQCLETPVPRFSIQVSYSENSCGERNDAYDNTPYTTAWINAAEETTCEKRGMCIVENQNGELVHVIHGLSAADCDNEENPYLKGISKDLPRRYVPYQCLERAVVDDNAVVGWTGDGCHPLQHGFPSACSCSSDAACMPDEKCLIGTHEPTGEPLLTGRCVMADSEEVFSCAASNGNCPNGRIFVEGSCVVPCSGPGTCESGRVCRQVDGAPPNTLACHAPHDIVYAESIAWGMENVTAPMHSVWTYSMADYYQLLLFGLGFKLDLQLPFPRKPISLINLRKVWDLGSKWKGWLQPGLQAHYQHECSMDAASAVAGGDDIHLYDSNLSPMTNYQPYRGSGNVGTIDPDVALDPAGLNGDLLCMGPGTGGPGVCRYRGDLDPTVALGNPSSVSHGNTARSVGEFLDWCKETMPNQAEFDVEAQDPTELMQSLADAMNWSYDLSIDLFQGIDVCVGDVPLYDYLGDLFETDGQGPDGMTMTNETTGEETFVAGVPNWYTAPCQYVGQHTDRCPNGDCTFACGEILDFAAEIWGCLDWDMDYWLHQMILSLANNQPVLQQMSNQNWAASFPFNEGLPAATPAMIDPNNPSILRPSVLNPNVQVLDFDAIFMRGATGAYPLTLDDMIGTFRDLDYHLQNPLFTLNQNWEIPHAPPFFAHNIGRSWYMDFTTCMDESAADPLEFGCTCTSHADCGEVEPGSYCEFANGPAPGVGTCWKNQPTRLSDDCTDGDSSTTCTVICSATGQPPADGESCPDYFFFPECTPFQLVLDGELNLCDESGDAEIPGGGDTGGGSGDEDAGSGTPNDSTSGACCTAKAGLAPCVDVERRESCDSLGGVFQPGASCADVDVCEEAPVFGACCLPNGYCRNNTTEIECMQEDGKFNPAMDCEECLCGPAEPGDDTPAEPGPGCGGCSTNNGGPGNSPLVLIAAFLLLLRIGSKRLRRAGAVALVAVGLMACADEGMGELSNQDDALATRLLAEQPLEPNKGFACCVKGQCLEDYDAPKCAEAGGVYQIGTYCGEEGACGSGACCSEKEGCSDDYPQEKCDELGGQWNPGGKCAEKICEAEQLGACCSEREGCLDDYSQEKCDELGGQWNPGGQCSEKVCEEEPPPAEGACCTAGGTCDELTELKCRENNGVYFHNLMCEDIKIRCLEISEPGEPVEPVEPEGACCLKGECAWLTAKGCQMHGGTFYEDQQCSEVADLCAGDAPPVGACCTDMGCVPDISAGRCEALNGLWHQGEACDQENTCPSEVPTGACCTEQGCIPGTSEDRCKILEGVWNEGVLCGPQTCENSPEPTGACCSEGSYSGIGTGRGYGCALNEDGSPVCFGFAMTGTPPPGPYVDIAATGHWACGRAANGAVDCWLTNGTVFTAPTAPMVSITMSTSRACGVTTTGTISCWDSDGSVIAANAPAGPWQSVVSDADRLCGLRTNGTVACWGNSVTSGAPLGIAPIYNEIAVVSGAVCGRLSNGGVVCMNYYTDGICNPGNHGGPLHSIGAFGSCGICGINNSNELECFGDISGSLSSGPVVQWDALYSYLCVLRPDHSVNCYNWGIDGLVVSDIAPPATGGCMEGVTEAQCDGTFHAGSTCEQINYCAVPTGACCADKYCYDDILEEDCVAKGGMFSAGMSCEDIDYCRAPLGACCTSSGCFENVTDALCTTLGGMFNQGSTCTADILCPELTGACCIEKTGECLNEETEESCAKQEGVFYENLSCGQCDCSPPVGEPGKTVDEAHLTFAEKSGGCATAEGAAASWLAIAGLFAVGLIRRRRLYS